jgi:purine-nucleoside phosphorylase
MEWYHNREKLLAAVLNSDQILTFGTIQAVTRDVLNRDVDITEYSNPDKLIAEAKTMDKTE